MAKKLDSQLKEVRSWLQEIFEGEDVPDFEVNEATIGYIYQIFQTSRHQDKCLQSVTKDYQEKANHYNAESQRLGKILQNLQISPEILSQNGESSLSALSKLAILLNVKDPSDTCFMLGLQDLDNELETVVEAAESVTNELNSLTSKYQSILQQCGSLQKTLKEARESSSENEDQNARNAERTAFVNRKTKSYKSEIAKIKAMASQSDFNESLFHENLVRKAETLQEIQDQMQPIKAELETLSVLPPDWDAAQLKLAEYKLELEKLDAALTDCIDVTIL